ncbi:MAG: helix-hairpin-helix domain-containing protein [Bacillota bacterium]|nr:helix-hairpin-helix domain-containing protein [Bacillota bacterium]
MKIKIKNKDKVILLILVILLIVTKVGVSVKQNNIKVTLDNSEENSEIELEIKEVYKVHIDGEIKNPNIYEVNEGDRLDSLIQKAGGLTENADISRINLARILEDGLKIFIPSIIEIKIENNTEFTLTDFNQLDKEGLMEINGIGEVIASKIIAYKTENGPFVKISDLLNVNGIGEKKLELIKNIVH